MTDVFARGGDRWWSVFLVLSLVAGIVVFAPLPAEAAEAKALSAVKWYSSDSSRSSNPCGSGWQWDDTDANKGAGADSDYIYLCTFYAPISTGSPITDVTVIANASDIRCPAGWITSTDQNGLQKDLNDNAGGDYVYLCYRKGGPHPLTELKVIPTFLGIADCGGSHLERLGTSLNSGTDWTVPAVYMCYADLSTMGLTWDCGGEGEEACGADTRFFWENGSSGCDRGLTLQSGTCEDDTRYQSAATSFQSTWTHWALLNQTTDLVLDVPIGEYTMVGAHNAFNNVADGYFFEPNQTYSITDMLRAGIRVIDLDIHAGTNGAEAVTGTRPELCHGTDLHGGCVVGDRLFDSALKEIKKWLVDNPDQTIVILLEDYIDRDPDEVEFGIELQFGGDPSIGVYRTTNAGGPPTRAQMLKHGRVFIAAQNDSYGTVVWQKTGDRQIWKRAGGQPINGFSPYPTCNTGDGPFLPLPQESYLVSEINGDRIDGFLGPADLVEAADLREVSKCGIDIINIDDILDADEADNGERLKGAIWSWTEGDRGHLGDAALMVGSTGRWRSANPADHHPYACRMGGAGLYGALKITTASGPWADGWDACQAEYGATATFMVPVNGWLNHQLNLKNLPADVWLNYNDIRSEGTWLINNRPTVQIAGSAEVNEGPNPVTFTFTVLDDPGDTFVAGEPDCGSAGSAVLGSLQTSGNGGSFQCVFPAGGDTVSDITETTVSIGAEDGVGVTDRLQTSPPASFEVSIRNVVPQVTGVTLSAPTVNEDGTVTVTGSFIDPGNDVHVVTIDWADGSALQEISVVAQARTFAASHKYLDDDPTATPSDSIDITVTVSDERGPSPSADKSVTILNVNPDVELDDAVDELGNVIGTDIAVALTRLEVTIVGRYTDIGTLDTHTVELDWDDGSAIVSGVSGAHRYLVPNDYSPSLTVTDDDTGVGSDESPLRVVGPAAALTVAVNELQATTTSNSRADRALDAAVTGLQGSRDGVGTNGALDFLDRGHPGVAVGAIQRSLRSLITAEEIDSSLDLSAQKDLLALTAKSIALEIFEAATSAERSDAKRLEAAGILILEGDAFLHASPEPMHMEAVQAYWWATLRLQSMLDLRGP